MNNPAEFFERIQKYFQLFRTLYSISPTPESEPNFIIYELYSSARTSNESDRIRETIDSHNLQSPDSHNFQSPLDNGN